jgi:hypothetical protein
MEIAKNLSTPGVEKKISARDSFLGVTATSIFLELLCDWQSFFLAIGEIDVVWGRLLVRGVGGPTTSFPMLFFSILDMFLNT